MFKLGEIVYHDHLYFNDGIKDNKQNRPCIVIYSNDATKTVITIPLTSSIKSFNRKNNNYVFIPYIIYNYHKLNFVKIDSILKNSYNNTHSTQMILDNQTLLKILNKSLANYKNQKYNQIIQYSIDLINEITKQEEKKNKKTKKLERTNRRRNAKRNGN